MSHAINGDVEGLTVAIEADRRDIAAADDRAVATMYATPQDLAALPEPCIDWLGAYARSAYTTSADGALEDWLSFVKPWGFEVADARNVAVWHGDQDVAVTPASAWWITAQAVGASLHLLAGEGHVSIALHLPTIIADLFERAP